MLTNLFYHRCRAATFKVQSAAFHTIIGITPGKLRASCYKLYRWMCSHARIPHTFEAKLAQIGKATGLSSEAIISARNELKVHNLIVAERLHGPGGGYQFTLLDADNLVLPLNWEMK